MDTRNGNKSELEKKMLKDGGKESQTERRN